MFHPRVVISALLVTSGALSSHAGTPNLSVGSDVTEFEITHCRTDPYASGKLVIAAEVTAVGSFRERPAALFMSKTSPASAGSDYFDLYVMELSPDLRTMPPLEARNKIMTDWATLQGERTGEIMADYTREKMEGVYRRTRSWR